MPAGGGTSQTAVVRAAGGQSQKASLVTAATALATMVLLAPLLGLMPNATLAAIVIVYSNRADPAGGVPRHPQSARDGVSLGALRLRRRAGVRHAHRHRRRHRRVDDRPGQPDGAPAGVGHRAQARGRRAAAAVARTSRRRDLRRPADRTAGRAHLFRERAGRRPADQRPRREIPAACAGARHEPCRRPRIFGAAGADRGRETRHRKRRRRVAGGAEPERPRDGTEFRAGRAARSRAHAVQRAQGD